MHKHISKIADNGVVKNPALLGLMLAFLSSLCNTGAVVGGKWVMSGGDPVNRGGFTALLSGIILSAYVFPKDGFDWMTSLPKKGYLYGGLFILTSIIALASFWIGLSLIDAAHVGFLSRLEIVVIVILGILFLKERFTILEALAGIVIFAGTLFIQHSIPRQASLGFWIALFSAFTMGLMEIFSKMAVKYIIPYRLTAVRNIIVGVVLLIWAAGKGTFTIDLGWYWAGIAFVSIMGPVLGRTIYLYALKYTEVTKVGLTTQIQPIFIMAAAIFFLNEFPSTSEIIGGTMIIAGCAGIILARRINS